MTVDEADRLEHHSTFCDINGRMQLKSYSRRQSTALSRGLASQRPDYTCTALMQHRN